MTGKYITNNWRFPLPTCRSGGFACCRVPVDCGGWHRGGWSPWTLGGRGRRGSCCLLRWSHRNFGGGGALPISWCGTALARFRSANPITVVLKHGQRMGQSMVNH